jgi:hypothetical protein
MNFRGNLNEGYYRADSQFDLVETLSNERKYPKFSSSHRKIKMAKKQAVDIPNQT